MRNYKMLKRMLFKRIGVRTFLSEAYQCKEAWDSRLLSPILKHIKMDDYAFQIMQKYEKYKFIHRIEIDIYVNKSTTDEHADNVKILLEKFHTTKYSQSLFDSSSAAILKLFFQKQRYDELFQILRQPVNFGVFIDNFTANIFMDTFLKQQRFDLASKIASQLMLQESIYNVKSSYIPEDPIKKNPLNINIEEPIFSPITPYLAMHSCLMNFTNGKKASDSPDHNIENSDTNSGEEQLYVRVPYLKPYYFDDHFDILSLDKVMQPENLLLGKTLSYVSDLTVNHDCFNNIIGRSAHLLGLGLWRKFDKACTLLEAYVREDSEPAITKDSAEFFIQQFDAYRTEVTQIMEYEKMQASKPKRHLPLFDFDQPPPFKVPYDLDALQKSCEDSINKLHTQNKVSDLSSLLDLSAKKTQAKVQRYEQSDIEAQQKLFVQWNKERLINLEEKAMDAFKQRKLKEISKQKAKLDQEEMRLTFFDREKELEITLDKAQRVRDLLYAKKMKGLTSPFRSSFEYMKE